MKNFLFAVLIIVLSATTFSQQNENSQILSGNFYIDSRLVLQEYSEVNQPEFSFSQGSKKSPLLAGVVSAAIPGAGEFYSGEYLKAAIFLVIEAGLITTALVYDSKANNKTEEFQKYADQNWSVVTYAEWLNEFTQSDITINPNESLQPWQRVNWQQLNEAERNANSALGRGFSHTLPAYGDQQYFELIGKYRQYSVGWSDYDKALYGSNWDVATVNMDFYSGMRGDANDFFNVSSKAVIGLYINHIVSALDAVWSAVQFNKDLAVKFRVENQQLVNRIEYVPKIYLKYSF
jgi:hypothetical protein